MILNDFYILFKSKEKEKNNNTKIFPKLELKHDLNRLNATIIILL
jgi:hypothetical protein